MSIPFVKLQPVYKIRVVYKSGFFQDFEATDFTIGKGTATWTSAKHKGIKPVLLGLDEIAAVWQLGIRHRIAW